MKGLILSAANVSAARRAKAARKGKRMAELKAEPALWLKPESSPLPTDRHAQPGSKPILVKQRFVRIAEFVNQLRDFHVVAAILRNLRELALSKPFDCL